MSDRDTLRRDDAPLVMHLIYRLTSGGLENGLVNLVNHMPPDRYRHVIVSMTDFTEFRERIERPEVEVVCLGKRSGHDPGYYWRLIGTIRKLRPAIFHSRTFAALDGQLIAWTVGVRGRVHGEHGRDVHDWEEEPRRRRWVRRAADRVVSHYIAVSDDIAECVVRNLGLSDTRITRIYNGVDCGRFRPRNGRRPEAYPASFQQDGALVLGWTGSLRNVKNPVGLVETFLRLRRQREEWRRRLRLAMVGDGPLREQCLGALREAGATAHAWLPGNRDDVPELLRGMDVFVLPSLNEGISNSILEAMATGLPVVATDVGGNRELVRADETGLLAPVNPDGLGAVVERYLSNADLRRDHGYAGRQRSREFSIACMVRDYEAVYDRVLAEAWDRNRRD